MAQRFTAPSVPKFDFEAFASLQRANLETAIEAQKILTDAAQAMVRLHLGWLNELVQQAQELFATREPKRPEAVLADVQANAERAFEVAREGFELGAKAQTKVVDLISKRAAANFDEVKSLAA